MKTKKNQLIAKVHVLKRRLGLDDGTYRDMLSRQFGVRSSAELDVERLAALCALMESHSGRRATGYPGRPRNMEDPDRGPLLRKVEALLADAKLPWGYAHAIAMRMHGAQRVEWLPPGKIRDVVAALEYRKKRRSSHEAVGR